MRAHGRPGRSDRLFHIVDCATLSQVGTLRDETIASTDGILATEHSFGGFGQGACHAVHNDRRTVAVDCPRPVAAQGRSGNVEQDMKARSPVNTSERTHGNTLGYECSFFWRARRGMATAREGSCLPSQIPTVEGETTSPFFDDLSGTLHGASNEFLTARPPHFSLDTPSPGYF